MWAVWFGAALAQSGIGLNRSGLNRLQWISLKRFGPNRSLSLAEVRGQLLDGEFLFAFLDDVHLGEARPHSDHPRLVERPVVHDGRVPTPHRQDPHVKPCGSVPGRMVELEPAVWSHEGTRVLELPSAAQSSSEVEQRTDRRRGTTVARCQICRVAGKSSSNVPARGATILSGLAVQPVDMVRRTPRAWGRRAEGIGTEISSAEPNLNSLNLKPET